MTTHTPQPSKVLWIDLETTDTDPYSDHAAILEIGAIITDWSPDLNELARASLLIRPSGAQPEHDLMWARMDPFVQQMHRTSGLWQEATSSDQAWGLIQADDAFAQWITEEVGEERIPIAGSGVGHLDLPFVKAHMPRTASRLTYWPLDTGNVRRILDLAGRSDLVDLATDVDAKPHRGLDDIELHVAEARRYLRLLAQIPRLEELPAPDQNYVCPQCGPDPRGGDVHAAEQHVI